MKAAHDRDMAEHQRMRDLKSAIQAFRADPPNRTRPLTLHRLAIAVRELDQDMAHIVEAWN